jgi:hypothetical protein
MTPQPLPAILAVIALVAGALPPLLAVNLSPSATMLNQCAALALWGWWVAVLSLVQLEQHLGMRGRHPQERLCRAGRLATPLFPVLERARRNPEQPRKLLLREPDLRARLCCARKSDFRDSGGLALAHLAHGLEQVLPKLLDLRGHLRRHVSVPQ